MSYSPQMNSNSKKKLLQQHISTIMLHTYACMKDSTKEQILLTLFRSRGLTALPWQLGVLFASEQLRHLVPALVVAFLQALISQRGGGNLQQITSFKHECQALAKELGCEWSSGGLGEGNRIRTVRCHAGVQRSTSSNETLLRSTTRVH